VDVHGDGWNTAPAFVLGTVLGRGADPTWPLRISARPSSTLAASYPVPPLPVSPSGAPRLLTSLPARAQPSNGGSSPCWRMPAVPLRAFDRFRALRPSEGRPGRGNRRAPAKHGNCVFTENSWSSLHRGHCRHLWAVFDRRLQQALSPIKPSRLTGFTRGKTTLCTCGACAFPIRKLARSLCS
jgi:hypothetical protein